MRGTLRVHQLLAYSLLPRTLALVCSPLSRKMPVGTRRTLAAVVSTTTNTLRYDVEQRSSTTLSMSMDDSSSTPERHKRIKMEQNTIVTPDVPTDEDKPRRKAPDGWQDIYTLVEELRADRTAPCDHSGCEALPDRTTDPKNFRFQVLLSLMLSSQTKDAVVGEAIRSMQADGVLSVEAIADMDPTVLNGYIQRVGFHNNKTKYIKLAVEILKSDYDSDIPPTAVAMMRLPGVGPKMAFICENVAWGRASGIGVDTHMHRLFNQLRWVSSKNPEQTRIQLEAWLPQDKWMEVNLLWVGFGQEVQQFKPKILRKALDCQGPADALRLLKRCGLDYVKEGKKLGLEEEIREALASGKEDKA